MDDTKTPLESVQQYEQYTENNLVDAYTRIALQDIAQGAFVDDRRSLRAVSKAVRNAYRMGIVRGRHDLKASGDVALLVGTSRQYVNRLARDLGIGEMFGRERLFREIDIAELRTYMATDRRRKQS